MPILAIVDGRDVLLDSADTRDRLQRNAPHAEICSLEEGRRLLRRCEIDRCPSCLINRGDIFQHGTFFQAGDDDLNSGRYRKKLARQAMSDFSVKTAVIGGVWRAEDEESENYTYAIALQN